MKMCFHSFSLLLWINIKTKGQYTFRIIKIWNVATYKLNDDPDRQLVNPWELFLDCGPFDSPNRLRHGMYDHRRYQLNATLPAIRPRSMVPPNWLSWICNKFLAFLFWFIAFNSNKWKSQFWSNTMVWRSLIIKCSSKSTINDAEREIEWNTHLTRPVCADTNSSTKYCGNPPSYPAMQWISTDICVWLLYVQFFGAVGRPMSKLFTERKKKKKKNSVSFIL